MSADVWENKKKINRFRRTVSTITTIAAAITFQNFVSTFKIIDDKKVMLTGSDTAARHPV